MLTGKYTVLDAGKNPDDVSDVPRPGFHSVVDDKNKPENFVVFKDFVAYPIYLIKFTG